MSSKCTGYVKNLTKYVSENIKPDVGPGSFANTPVTGDWKYSGHTDLSPVTVSNPCLRSTRKKMPGGFVFVTVNSALLWSCFSFTARLLLFLLIV